ncbi:hypothetical protein HBE96_17540 [Clostridium sp. P21]|uniref:Uncharacterized protein n=1 Tax=Clostridium muellerianum TaxID=2716538 RepID=A0A7Y0HPN9_9CLOT|nr:hypothetical protein [Clostridium muellerianum]NMM64425.1 hypothetical protein [Clostridium muellerianum]
MKLNKVLLSAAEYKCNLAVCRAGESEDILTEILKFMILDYARKLLTK